MDKKDKNTAVTYNILIPGVGDMYVEKNSSTQGILIVGIITTIISLGILFNIFQELVRANTFEGLYDRMYRDRSGIYFGLGFGLFVCLVLPRVIFVLEVIDRVTKFNNRLSNNFPPLVNSSSIEKNEIKNSIINTEYNSEKFISEIHKVKNLRENEVYSEDEYLKRKYDIINNLTNKGISQSLEDFLLEIIPLKKNNILTGEEINQIKSSLSDKSDIKQSNTSNLNIEECTAIRDDSLPAGFNSYFCGKCNFEIELDGKNVKNKSFVCTKCNSLNKIKD